jgi:hypothetical protein
MQALTGVFLSRETAERAVRTLHSSGVAVEKITLLTPGDLRDESHAEPIDAAEQPGMGKAIGAVIGAAGGLSTGAYVAAIIPGVGWVTAAGLLGMAILTAAGAGVGAAAGGSLENRMTEGLPEDEIFLYEDALRKGRTVVIALAHDEKAATSAREVLKIEGAESVDAARERWWTGLRSAEQEHYAGPGRNFSNDERFYRMGFEASLHAKWRCKEFDQVSQEMANKLEDLERQYPGVDLREPFTRGYERGREYYQHLCEEQSAA